MIIFGVDVKKKPEQNENKYKYFMGWCRGHCT
jgi:hypothetical protein